MTIFYGVGVGPGDPELITLKAARLIRSADVVSYICNQEGMSQSKDIALNLLHDKQKLIPVFMPMSIDRTKADLAYDAGAELISSALADGKNVVFLCEGDPLFFGSFSYLLERMRGQYQCEVVPGISSVHAASAVLQQPLTMLKESFVVISGRHTDQQIEQALLEHDSLVIMKAGQSRSRILALLEKTERLTDAKYLEYIGRKNQQVIDDVTLLANEDGPYFSLFVVSRR